jgi:endo-1,4-beta-xylanase
MFAGRSCTHRPDRKLLGAARSALSWQAAALLAFGASACGGDEGGSKWTDTSPIIVQAESGQLGASVMRVTDAMDSSITYVTAGVNVTDAPADLSDSRVSSQVVEFPAAGTYQIYARVRIGPGGGDDDSFFINTATNGAAPTWANINGISGWDVAGGPRYQESGLVSTRGGNSAPGVWRWALFDTPQLVIPEGQLTQTFSFSTREDGLEIDRFAFALRGDDYTVGFTTAQLDAGQAGEKVPLPVIPPAFTPPANQPPLAIGTTKYLGSVCCGAQRDYLENYFNQVVPENASKWGSVEAVRGTFNWTGVDEALAVAEANGFPFRFHVLVWGSQQPAWIATLPPEEQLQEIRTWFQAVADRYGERINFLEVVNEFSHQPPTAANSGNYVDALGGTGETGFDWVITAFRMAREIFPRSVKLMINEYSIINDDRLTQLYLQVIQRLQEEDLIDAVAEQAHAFTTTGEIEPMVDRLNQLGATGLPLYLNEFDLDGPPPQQLVSYQRVFRAFWENPNVHGVTLWGYRDGMWRTQQDATLVYPNGAEKPALRWLKGYLRGTAPVVSGPTAAALSARASKGTEVATFGVTGPDGAAYPASAEVSWGFVEGGADQAVILQALAFAAGTGRLEIVKPLAPGSYRARVYADVDATVSDLYDVDITVQ